MAMKLVDGDYLPDGRGGFEGLRGSEELLGHVLFLLQARRGSFPLLPQVGSRLYLLPRAKAGARESLGASYAAEALAGIQGLQVTGASWQEETGRLTVYVTWRGEGYSVTVRT